MPQLVKIGLLSSTALASGLGPAATWAFDAATGALPGGTTFTRASGATRVDARGYLGEVAADVPRYTYDPTLAYNLVPNPWADGSPPTGWSTPPTTAGITTTFLGTGTAPDGLPMARYRFSGTRSGSSYPSGRMMDAASSPPCAVGDAFTSDIGIYLESVVSMPSVGIGVGLSEYGAAGNWLNANTLLRLTDEQVGTYARMQVSRTASHASVVSMAPSWNLSLFGSVDGDQFDFVVGFVFPVMVRGSTQLTDTVPLSVLSTRVGTTPQHGLLGLLLEETSTNAFPNTRDLSGWSTTGVTLTAAAAPAPNGLVEATRVTDSDVTGAHYSQHAPLSVVGAIGETWTFSAFVKAETRSVLQVSLPSATFGIDAWANFDLGNAVLGSMGPAATPTMERYPNGWWRIAVTGLSTASGASAGPAVVSIVSPTNGRLYSFLGAGSTFLQWGAQMEKAPFPSSVSLPPSGSPVAVTRARDNLLLPSSLITTFANGTIATRYATARGGATGAVLPSTSYALTFGTSAERVQIRQPINILPRPTWEVFTGSAAVASLTTAVGANDTFYSSALAWGGGEAYAAFDGTLASPDTSASSPTPSLPTNLGVNQGSTATAGTGIVLKHLRVWNGRKLSQAQVQRESKRL